VQPWRIPTVALAFLLALHAPAARPAEELSVEAERQGDAVEIRARAVVFAPLSLAWEVLTDYEKLPRFIPGMSRSVVTARNGARVVVEQSGEARFLFFGFPIETRLDVVETARERVVSRAVAGNLRRMDGRYDISRDEARMACILVYRGAIEPGFDLPPLIGVAAMRAMVEEQFTAMVAEIERRAALAGK
jgi:ribosome-associated toxin RatA of RatAB toxin-antitoxin module